MPILTSTLIFAAATAFAAQDSTSAGFLEWMDRIAQKQLDQREAKIASVRDANQARARQAEARAKILQLIGGLPDYAGPLKAQTHGAPLDGGDYTIERVTFESLPDFLVTGNLFIPKKPGKHPAILFPLGHWDQGKPAAQHMAGNLAAKGFVVLAYDPIGQGERQQAFDARANRSLIGGSTEQHFMAGANAILIGQSFARYRIWDAKRGIDYLVSRPEVDAERIGVTGCSGGGTVTTYISALDPRVKVSAPACYMNSFRLVFTGPVGDSEQSPLDFISSGLDETDYVELFAPKPWLISSTELDFFTPAGAKIVYEEAKRWYNLFGAEDKIKWVVGPGGHGTPEKVREEIYGWMMKWLNVPGSNKDAKVRMYPDHQLWVMPKGQVAGKSREIYEVIRDEMNAKKVANADLQGYLKKWIYQPEETSPTLHYQYEGPAGNITKATLIVQTMREPSPQFKQLAAEGPTALVTPRGLPVPGTPNLSGDWIANTRSWLIGRNLPAMRAKDILRAVDELEKKGAKQITVVASDVPGIWALLAAAVDPRITELQIERTPYSVRASFDSPMHRNLHDVVMPGFALLGDYRDLVAMIQPSRKVVWKDPTDWMRNVVPLTDPLYTYSTYSH